MSDEDTKKPKSIAVERLVMCDPKGIQLPHGPLGENVQVTGMLKAGMNNNIRVEIHHRPWMRAFRVVRSMREQREENGKQVDVYKPMGRPFHIHETKCTWVYVEEV